MSTIVYIAGSRSIEELPQFVCSKLQAVIDKGYYVLIGGETGADEVVQRWLAERSYRRVVVYADNSLPFCNAGAWDLYRVGSGYAPRPLLSRADIGMVKDADAGLMLWDGHSQGTQAKAMQLLAYNKTVLLCYLPTKQAFVFRTIDELRRFIRQ